MKAAVKTLPSKGVSLDLGRIDAIRNAINDGQLTEIRRISIGGNDAIAKAALEAGALFFAGYPITPSSEVLEYVARYIFAFGGSYLQMEDEISSIAAAIGASIAGVKSFTASSGPGFSLKQENLGYACILEIPLVVINVQRGGPSTGGPTDVGQSDIMQARWGTHGDHPIIVVAPNSVQECYEETVRAFNLSEKYRTPVIILSDAKVGQMKEALLLPPRSALPIFDRVKPDSAPKNYEPFGMTANGVPPLAAFGEGYRSHFTGLYHGRDGLPTKDPKMIDEQMRRTHAKLATPEARKDIRKTESFMLDDAEEVVVAFGITARAAKDAVIEARRKGIKAGLLRPVTVWPSDAETIIPMLAKAKRVWVAELNLGQYIEEIQRLAYEMAVSMKKVPPPVLPINRVDMKLITPQDILAKITS